ncbi:hypothetical protein OZX65_03925 [Leuconostocaceae bacterium ESL0723]|nr:hypothetical protein OZX65_03925 [Leuconostocaceae bacterium ESL0723]
MANKAEALIKKNNQLRQQLSPENNKFYSDFMVYVRTQSLDQDEYAMESQLLSILQDVIDAQNDGISAADYFGKSPRELGDELVASLPRNFWSTVKDSALIILNFGFFALFPALVNPRQPIDFGSLLITGCYLLVIITLAVRWVGKAQYNPKFEGMNAVGRFFLLFLACLIAGLPAFASLVLLKTPLHATLTGWVGIAAILVADAVALIGYRLSDNRDLNKFFIPIVGALSLLGILTRLPGVSSFITTKTGQVTLALTLLVIIVIWNVWTGVKFRRMGKKADLSSEA